MQFPNPHDPASLIAFHRSVFGDARMEDDPEVDPDKKDDDAPPEGDDEPFDEARAKAKITKTNSEAAALRKRLQAAESRVKEFEDANKSDTDKLTERATASEKRAETAEHKLLRLQIALEKGLTVKQANRLVGSSQEELEADAEDMLADLAEASGDQTTKPRVSTKPKENLRGGGDPEQEPEETDPAKLAALIPRRY